MKFRVFSLIFHVKTPSRHWLAFPLAGCHYSYLLKWRCSFHTSVDRRLRPNRSIKCERVGERERIRRLYLWKLFFSLLRLLLIRIWWAFPNLRKRVQSYWTSRCSVRFMPVKWQWDEFERVAMKPKEWISEIWSFATQQESPSIKSENAARSLMKESQKIRILIFCIKSHRWKCETPLAWVRSQNIANCDIVLVIIWWTNEGFIPTAATHNVRLSPMHHSTEPEVENEQSVNQLLFIV